MLLFDLEEQTMKKLLWILLFLSIAGMLTLSACDKSNDSQTPTNNHIHAFDEWTTTKKANCTEEGVNERYCACGEKQTQIISALGHTHIIDDAVAATCTTEGKTEGKHCSVCGEVVVVQTTVGKIGHIEVIDVAVSATCTVNGKTEGKHCFVCNEILVHQTEINKLEHNYIYTSNPATCTEDGYITAICDCGETLFKEVVPTDGHEFENGVCIYCYEDDPNYIALSLSSTTYNINLEDDNDVAYITMIGGETITYDIADTAIVGCEWGDWDGDVIPLTFIPISNGNTVVTVYIKGYDKCIKINVSVAEHSHSFSKTVVQPKCLVGGYTIYLCDCGYSYNGDQISAKGHNEVIDPAVLATPTSTGLTEGKHCLECNTIIVEQKVIPIQRKVTIDGEGEVFHYYIVNRIRSSTLVESVDYVISEHINGKIEIKINYLVEMIYNGGSPYVAFKIELHNSDGVCIATSQHFSSAEYNTKYLLKDTFSYLEPGDYSIIIKDY